MDKFIAAYNFKKKHELNYCEKEGVAYQSDMNRSISYNQKYFEKYLEYENTPMGKKLNEFRVDLVKSWCPRLKIIDIGIGCGTFIKYALIRGLNIQGFDINPYAQKWLKNNKCFENIYNTKQKFLCYTFWDSLEHIPYPQKIFDKLEIGSYVFVSMPIFAELEHITKSKHYRPDEHYYYFTLLGLLRWFAEYNCRLIKFYDFEQKAGREGIITFLFERIVFKKGNKINILRDYFKFEADLAKLYGEVGKCLNGQFGKI